MFQQVINKMNVVVKVIVIQQLNHIVKRKQENIHIHYMKMYQIILKVFVVHILIYLTLEMDKNMMLNLK